jgi:hypothetical protein
MKRNKLTAIFLTGTILLIIGVALWLYTNSVIQGHEQLLNNPNITQQEKWNYEGSLEWWKMAKITTYDPIAVILITAGLIALLYVTLWAIIQPQ